MNMNEKNYINKESSIDSSLVYSVSNKEELNKLLGNFGDGRSSKYLSQKPWIKKDEDTNSKGLNYSIEKILSQLNVIEKKLDNIKICVEKPVRVSLPQVFANINLFFKGFFKRLISRFVKQGEKN
jgi:hypothetical protein